MCWPFDIFLSSTTGFGHRQQHGRRRRLVCSRPLRLVHCLDRHLSNRACTGSLIFFQGSGVCGWCQVMLLAPHFRVIRFLA